MSFLPRSIRRFGSGAVLGAALLFLATRAWAELSPAELGPNVGSQQGIGDTIFTAFLSPVKPGSRISGAGPPNPYDRDVLSTLVYYSQEAGQTDSALRYFTQPRELDPENPEYAKLASKLNSGAEQ